MRHYRKYIEKIYRSPHAIEHEFSFKGRYGAKGEKRAPRRKATKEQIRRQNLLNRIKRIRRTIRLNWEEGDLWLCLKYPEGYRLPLEEVEKDVNRFLSNVRRAYKKMGCPFKWYLRVEVGERGGIHIHMIVNRIWGAQTDLLLEEKWRHQLKRRKIADRDTYGKVDWKSLYAAGGYGALAKYIAKTPEEDSEEYRQLSLFDEPEKKRLCSIRCSKNLIRPEPEVKEYYQRTMRKIIEEGPTPEAGYYIDPDSIVSGINPYTGLSYYQYTEYRISRERGYP